MIPRNYEGNTEEEKTVPSSSNEIFTDQLGVRMMVRGWGGGRRYSACPLPLLQQATE
jgi:hypothetical protein